MTGDWLRIPNVITPGEWYHIGVTYDGKKMIAYLNGKEIAQRDTSVKPPQEAGSFLMGRFLGGGYFYNGLIDDVSVFNTALTADDVNLIMEQGMKKILGGNAVSPLEKLPTTWSAIKNNR